MVGIFSRFSGGRSGHRRAQSAADTREATSANMELGGSAHIASATSHGIDVAIEFKPVERPSEPITRDQPIKCPLPEPSILNDGRIWKERMSTVSTRAIADLPVVKEGSQLESSVVQPKPQSAPAKRHILPSLSAPEHNLLNLLDECNESGNQSIG